MCLVSRVFHFQLFNTSVDLTSCEEPVITLPHDFEVFVIYFLVAYHMYPTGVSSNQNKVE